LIRIKVIRKPTVREIDGIRLDLFHPGVQYELGNGLGAVFLAEGWAEPVPFDDEPAVVIPVSECRADRAPPNLSRAIYPPYYDAPAALAADRRHGLRLPRARRAVENAPASEGGEATDKPKRKVAVKKGSKKRC
jgi:hypothetical protein